MRQIYTLSIPEVSPGSRMDVVGHRQLCIRDGVEVIADCLSARPSAYVLGGTLNQPRRQPSIGIAETSRPLRRYAAGSCSQTEGWFSSELART